MVEERGVVAPGARWRCLIALTEKDEVVHGDRVGVNLKKRRDEKEMKDEKEMMLVVPVDCVIRLVRSRIRKPDSSQQAAVRMFINIELEGLARSIEDGVLQDVSFLVARAGEGCEELL
jgi:16S rRNA C1402 N4-methylase RsmH